MEIRLLELIDEFNKKLDLISRYLNKNEFQFDIKEITNEDEFIPIPRQLEEDPNKRRLGRVAHYSNGIISFSYVSSQMIWYIAWLAFLIKSGQEDRFNENDFIERLIRVDKVVDAEDMTCKNLHEWDNEDLNSIFLYAMSFLLCHELGHHVYQHPGYRDNNFKMRDPELLKRNELQADSFAADCVKDISNIDENESELGTYGIIVAQIAIMFIRNKEEHDITHPDPDTRLLNSLNGIDRTPMMDRFIENARDLSEIYLERRFV
nr:phage exclusion protein Lit family protein [Prevotella sp. FD3004]